VAIKIMNPVLTEKDKNLLKNELSAMSCLNHKNIVNVEKFGNEAYNKCSGKSKQVDYIVLELASGGELFDFISSSGRFEEPLARYYMKQLLEGLNYCHDNGICHRDMKPENLLLDGQYTLKIADFGFAAPIMGRDGQGYLETKLGTLNYMAPEIHLKQPYEGKSVDIFAAGIILFIMVA
jgi:serine/threonine protein kinase